MKEIFVKVSNRNGMHLRLAGELVKNTSKFSSDIRIVKNGEEINGKSILSVAGLGAEYGSKLIIRAEGNDEDEALKLLKRLFDTGFSEG